MSYLPFTRPENHNPILHCDKCLGFERHAFSKALGTRDPMVYAQIFECGACGHARRYGLVSIKTPDTSKDKPSEDVSELPRIVFPKEAQNNAE